MGQGQKSNFTVFEAQNLLELKLIAENAAATLASIASEIGEECFSLNVLELKVNGRDIGNWSVTVQRQDAGICH